jgi:hypothetical protein
MSMPFVVGMDASVRVTSALARHHSKECAMAVSLEQLSALLANLGLRHHLDHEEAMLHVLLATRSYVNARGERLAVVRITAADEGRLCRATIERAVPPGHDLAATCLAACGAVADVPLAGIEHDRVTNSLRLVAEIPVEDGTLTPAQLGALVDSLAAGAEAVHRAAAHRDAA